MKIELLSDNLHLIPQIVKLKFKEFSYIDKSKTIEDYFKSIKAHLNDKQLPIAYVVVNDSKEFIGTFCLKQHDLETYQHLSPWLGSVVVHPDKRNQGIGTFMVRQAEVIAAEKGYTCLYLFTPNKEAWYSKLGWEPVEHMIFKKIPIVVMRKLLIQKGKFLVG